jgi:hypothetical protein
MLIDTEWELGVDRSEARRGNTATRLQRYRPWLRLWGGRRWHIHKDDVVDKG